MYNLHIQKNNTLIVEKIEKICYHYIEQAYNLLKLIKKN